MIELDPELKRLMKLAGPAMPEAEPAPFGFSTRVISAVRAGETPWETGCQSLFRVVSWLSGLVLVLSSLFLFRQTLVPRPAADFATATQFVAKSILP